MEFIDYLAQHAPLELIGLCILAVTFVVFPVLMGIASLFGSRR